MIKPSDINHITLEYCETDKANAIARDMADFFNARGEANLLRIYEDGQKALDRAEKAEATLARAETEIRESYKTIEKLETALGKRRNRAEKLETALATARDILQEVAEHNSFCTEAEILRLKRLACVALEKISGEISK